MFHFTKIACQNAQWKKERTVTCPEYFETMLIKTQYQGLYLEIILIRIVAAQPYNVMSSNRYSQSTGNPSHRTEEISLFGCSDGAL